MAVGEKNVGVGFVLIQFYELTPFKSNDAIPRFFEKLQEIENLILLKSKFYDSYEHHKKFMVTTSR